MSTPRHPALRIGSDQFVVGPWHGDESTAYVGLGRHMLKPSRQGVGDLTAHLQQRGFTRAFTAAFRDAEAAPFLDAGFRLRESLCVLRHRLGGLREPTNPANLRRAHRRDHAAVLSIDHLGFQEFWRLDAAGLVEALEATESVRFRLAVEHRAIVGYMVCGRSSNVGYLQRLGVHPGHMNHGVGSTLVLDALAWLRRRNASHALVNTQLSNQRALDLYERLGFTREPDRLHVLEWTAP